MQSLVSGLFASRILFATADGTAQLTVIESDSVIPSSILEGKKEFLPPDGTGQIETYLKAGWNEADIRDYLKAYFETFTNKLQFPYLRIPGAYSYWQALDVHLAEAAAGQLSPEAALKASAVDFEEITIRRGRERQRQSYRASLGQ